MIKKNILFIGSNIHNAIGHEWVVNQLDKEKFTIHFILMNDVDSILQSFLENHENCNFFRINYSSKKNLPKAIFSIFNYIRKHKINLVHTHLLDASIAGLIAAKFARVKNRIHTRHHSDYHHKYHKHAVFYDRMNNFLSTKIIAVSANVKSILVDQEKVNPTKIEIIHHGFDISNFSRVPESRIDSIRDKYKLDTNSKVIGCISRYEELKGLQYTIPAFKLLLNNHPKAILVLANAKGKYRSKIKSLLSEIPEKNVREIEFENDIAALYQTFDVFVHIPIDRFSEAFGQTYIEALAAGIPSVFTKSGIAYDFAENKKNCIVVNYKSIEEVKRGISEILSNSELSEQLRTNGFRLAQKKFDLKNMIKSLELIYSNHKS